MTEKLSSDQVNPILPPKPPKFYRNRARAQTLAGRHRPNEYTSPHDTQHLMNASKFYERYIKNKANNLYEDNNIVEIPDNGEVKDAAPLLKASQIPVPEQTSSSANGRMKEGFEVDIIHNGAFTTTENVAEDPLKSSGRR